MRGKLLFSPHPLALADAFAGALPPHPHQRAQCALWKPIYRALRRGRIAKTLFSAQYNFYFTLSTDYSPIPLPPFPEGKGGKFGALRAPHPCWQLTVYNVRIFRFTENAVFSNNLKVVRKI